MSNLVLIDSSIWITLLRGEASQVSVKKVESLIEENLVVTIPIIINELLQGTKNKKEYFELKKQLESLKLEIPDYSKFSWDEIHELSFELSKSGIKAPLSDILIAYHVTKNNYLLYHCDKHFKMISKVRKIRFFDD